MNGHELVNGLQAVVQWTDEAQTEVAWMNSPSFFITKLHETAAVNFLLKILTSRFSFFALIIILGIS